MQRVVVGLSGGVDSSVAAYQLKKQGYEVIGLFMKNWHDTVGLLTGNCEWNEDSMFAEMVARKLDIPFNVVDLSTQYRQRVVDYLFAEYEIGRTPNPDVLCNREIKFDVFLKTALDMGADFVATGHYCRKDSIETENGTIYRLLAGTDPNKDQSYFLCQLSQQQLSKALFPVGHLLKPQVREIAAELGLATATRKDSQGICFVGKVDLPVFLQQKLSGKKGRIIEILPDFKEQKTPADINTNLQPHELEKIAEPYIFQKIKGKFAGEHNGAHFFTIGQRKGINIGGRKKPLFVIGTDVHQNVLYVGEGEEHCGLYRQGLSVLANEVHWVRPDLQLKPGEVAEYMVRIRYRQPLQKALLFMHETKLYVIFEEMQRGITPGQFAAFYKNDELIGSGTINE